jgi:hypothetical protein
MTSFWRVVWREGGSHSTHDHDTHAEAHEHETRLRVRPGVSICFSYQIDLIEETQ